MRTTAFKCKCLEEIIEKQVRSYMYWCIFNANALQIFDSNETAFDMHLNDFKCSSIRHQILNFRGLRKPSRRVLIRVQLHYNIKKIILNSNKLLNPAGQDSEFLVLGNTFDVHEILLRSVLAERSLDINSRPLLPDRQVRVRVTSLCF